MDLFGKKSSIDHARVAGEILAIRVALTTLLEAAGSDFPIVGEELVKFRAAGLAELHEVRASRITMEGFGDFMRGFIAAARRNG